MSGYEKYHDEVQDTLDNIVGLVLTPIGRRTFPRMLIQVAEEARELKSRQLPTPMLDDCCLTVHQMNVLDEMGIASISQLVDLAISPKSLLRG